MDSAIEGSYAILLARLKELLGIYGKDSKNMGKVLRAFYKMVVFDEEFDNALIEFLKQVIVNFIKRYANIAAGVDGTLQNTIMKYEHILSLIHICRCRRYAVCRSRWSPYH
eukprot:TRINITY_DN1060_c0_g1_i1.p1 TRINITY_DN1060_c0_g1~~TRINITY_DN1060_c0_g1_i1.p1  ORF type:complete len:111 (-),score=29.01 TRINITY_DN1060_c0_g1_i1:20-352(-)